MKIQIFDSEFMSNTGQDFVLLCKPLSDKTKRRRDKTKKAVRGKESEWWRSMTRDSQQQYLRQHKRSTKKQLNLKDLAGVTSMLPGEKTRGGKKDKEKKTYTSEELLKKAGIPIPTEGLRTGNPLIQRPTPEPPPKQEKPKNVNMVDENLPPVPPEHPKWKGFRQVIGRHIDDLGTSSMTKITDRRGLHRAYNGITDFMQGKQPTPDKRQAAEDMVTGIIDDLGIIAPNQPNVDTVSQFKKEAASLYFTSLKDRYADRGMPFRESTHNKLRRYNPSIIEGKEPKTKAVDLMVPKKTERDEFAHVASFVSTDFVDWLTTQDVDKLRLYLSSRKNQKVSPHDLKLKDR